MPVEIHQSLLFAHGDARVPLCDEAHYELLRLARKIRSGDGRKYVLEIFKRCFCQARGSRYAPSSSESWIDKDFDSDAENAALHAPEFIKGFCDACEELKGMGCDVPEHNHLNEVLARTGCEFRVENGVIVPSAPMVEAPDPPLDPASEVSKALSDAQALLGQSGAASAIDRAHTALHGYLRHLCTKAGIDVQADVPASRLFKCLREHHPAFNSDGHRADEVSRLLKAMSTIVDALNTIRNKASAAHPNELLDDPEASAALNAARTVFRYVQDCISRHESITS